MKIITGRQQSGKTDRLIRMSAKDNLQMVVHSKQEAHRIMGRAEAMGLKIIHPITFDDLLGQGYFGASIRGSGLAIDNLDVFLERIAGGCLTKVAAIEEEKEDEEENYVLEKRRNT